MRSFIAGLVLCCFLPGLICRAADAPASKPAAHPGSLLFAPTAAERVTFVWYDQGPFSADWANAAEADLEKAIRQLRPNQKFNLIYQGQTLNDMFPPDGKFIPGNADAIDRLKLFYREAQDFHGGDASLEVSLKRLAQPPQAISLLTSVYPPDAAMPGEPAKPKLVEKPLPELEAFAVKSKIALSAVALIPSEVATVSDEFKMLDGMVRRTRGTLRAVPLQEMEDAGNYSTSGDYVAANSGRLGFGIGFGNPGGAVAHQPPSATTITFVCDSSEAMKPALASVKSQLNLAISGLRPSQFFNVIFLREKDGLSLYDHRLARATPQHKRQSATFIADAKISAKTSVLPGLEEAMSVKPQLLYICAGGDLPHGETGDEILKKIHALNTPLRTKINTIVLVSDAQKDDDFATLKAIAQQNCGSFKVVIEGGRR